MDEKLDKAIETVLDQVRTNLKPPEALQQTQAVLNLAHAKKLLVPDTPGPVEPVEPKGKTTTRKQGAGS